MLYAIGCTLFTRVELSFWLPGADAAIPLERPCSADEAAAVDAAAAARISANDALHELFLTGSLSKTFCLNIMSSVCYAHLFTFCSCLVHFY